MSRSRKRLLVLGAGGLLGSEFLSANYVPGWEVLGHGRQSGFAGCADLASMAETNRMLDQLNPDAVLNLTGLTNVDRCEAFPEEAYSGNVRTVENVVAWIRQADKPVQLVHISTDQVYDGVGLHREGSVCLKNYYAFSKYAGELAASSVGAAVLRTNFFGKSRCARRASLTDWLFAALAERTHIQVFEDVLFSPLSSTTLCQMLGLVIEKRMAGIYNLGSRDGLSKADFSFAFAGFVGADAGIMSRCSVRDVDFLKAYRPRDMRLDVERFEHAAGIVLPCLVDEIKIAAQEYKK